MLLRRAPAMRDFRMASSRVGAEGAIALAEGLSCGAPHLETLQLPGLHSSSLEKLLIRRRGPCSHASLCHRTCLTSAMTTAPHINRVNANQ